MHLPAKEKKNKMYRKLQAIKDFIWIQMKKLTFVRPKTRITVLC